MNQFRPQRKPVISLLGVSGSGKSSVAREVSSRLREDDIRSTTIKKDDAIRLFGSRKASEEIGYIQGARNETDVLKLMNLWLRQALENIDVVFLEGGTRTPAAREIVMSGTESETELTIVRFSASPLTVARRLRERRRTEKRADDNPIIMAGKLAGQYYKDVANHGQTFDGIRYEIVDADQPLPQVATSVEAIVREQLQ